jgi:hypothetical protein
MTDLPWDEHIHYKIAECQQKGRLLVAMATMTQQGFKVCSKGCGTYYNPDEGHECV